MGHIREQAHNSQQKDEEHGLREFLSLFFHEDSFFINEMNNFIIRLCRERRTYVPLRAFRPWYFKKKKEKNDHASAFISF